MGENGEEMGRKWGERGLVAPPKFPYFPPFFPISPPFFPIFPHFPPFSPIFPRELSPFSPIFPRGLGLQDTEVGILWVTYESRQSALLLANARRYFWNACFREDRDLHVGPCGSPFLLALSQMGS